VIEHRFEPVAADVLLGGTIECIAHSHVVGRNGFYHRAGRTAYVEEPAGDFLPSPDLGKRAVGHWIAV